jgi:uncharacterized SAM-binding protein YcdF (DUF218 family)
MSLALAGLWFSQCEGVGHLLERSLSPPPALSPQRLAELRQSIANHRPVVVVLGGGAIPLAPEYGEALLSPLSMQRLHYGLWLGRQLQASMMFSGGAGLAQPEGPAEALIAQRIAQRDYGRTIRWVESQSQDTRGNARLTLQMLKDEGISDVIIVTHGWHMLRAMRSFQQEAARTGFSARIVPAPMGMGSENQGMIYQWLPTPDGARRVSKALREMLGLLAGA